MMQFKAMGLDEIRERRVVRTIKRVEAKPWTISVWRTGRGDGAGKGG